MKKLRVLIVLIGIVGGVSAAVFAVDLPGIVRAAFVLVAGWCYATRIAASYLLDKIEIAAAAALTREQRAAERHGLQQATRAYLGITHDRTH